jgi:ferrous iron transport protein B
MHPLWGVPVLATVLVLMYYVVGRFGAGICVDFVERRIFEGWLNPWAVRIVSALTPGPLHLVGEALVGEYGLFTVGLKYALAIVLPIVSTFFLFFGLLEDSGYLPRLAVMANRVFKPMGLNGKAVLPMVLGLGCDTMATLTARILDSKKERVIVTLLLALGVPCSAQLGVILGMLQRISWRATLIWAGSVVAILFLVGWLAAKVIPGRGSDFVIEIPPLRVPQLGNIASKTLARIEWYLREAVPLFLIGTFILFLFEKLHLLGAIEAAAAPVVQGWLHLPAQATESFIIGFLRRDYGAAGLFALQRDGLLDPIQVVVSMVTITLFVPCIANFIIIIKERGWKTAAVMTAFIFAFAFGVGGALNYALRALGVSL